jgi:hypothetical protein
MTRLRHLKGAFRRIADAVAILPDEDGLICHPTGQ